MRNISIVLGALFLLASSAQASPYLCYKAIKAAKDAAKSIQGNEFTNFQKMCEDNLECKSGCREDRKQWKKDIKAWEKGCKSQCKSSYKENKKGTKGLDKKKLKALKKECINSCKQIAKDDRALMKSVNLNKCGKFCKATLSKDCQAARRQLAAAITIETLKNAPKVVGACSAL
jgi:hypothetical protein